MFSQQLLLKQLFYIIRERLLILLLGYIYTYIYKSISILREGGVSLSNPPLLLLFSSVKMSILTCILQLVLGIVSLLIPTGVAIHLLATNGRDAAAAETAYLVLQYFLLLCCLQQLLQFFPVSSVLSLFPGWLVVLLKLSLAVALVLPQLSLPPKIVSFCLSHYDEYLTAFLAAADDKVLKPIKENVEKALDRTKQSMH